MAKFLVMRGHVGDKVYVEGETREAAPGDVAHLIPLTLQPIDEAGAAKARPAAKDKARKPGRNK